MSKFQKLAKINKIANECIQDGDFVLASKFHSEFMKIAQMDPSPDTYRANGPNMQKAIGAIQSNLLLPADGLFGPSTAYAIVKALDGIAPEQNLDKAYVERAREFVQSLPAGFVTKLKRFVAMKNDIRGLEKEPFVRATEIEPSNLKIKLIEGLGDYKG
jgi:hypothetical protein